jgi:arabinose-5-phosphate isomerase
MAPEDIIALAKDVLASEAGAIQEQIDKLGDDFVNAIEILKDSKGKVILTGMGKSGIICRKIVATFASTGTPAFFLHPGEAIHGDLGMVMSDDVLVALSNSGETEEILSILPAIKRMGVKIIAFVGNSESTLSRHADVVINVGVTKEACPMGLAPTSSTTAALAVGDAMAVVLLREKGFSLNDFAVLHPGGFLGKRLKLVSDLMSIGDDVPVTHMDTSLIDSLYEISSKRLGVTGVLDEKGSLVGVITDGDLRRAMEKKIDIYRATAKDIMTENPKSIKANELAAKALSIMEQNKITSLFVFDEKGGEMVGVIHIHDLLRAKIT